MSVHWPMVRRLVLGAREPVLTDDRRAYRGVEILAAAAHVAAELERRCQSPTVAVMVPTSGAFPIAALGAWMLGKTVVPLNYLLKEDELGYIVRDCGTDTIVSVQPMLDHLGFTPKDARVLRLEDLDFRSFPELRWPARAHDDDLAVLLYTSGTTGKPKGVMLTHANLSSNLRQVIDWVSFTRRDVMLGVLPQFHSFGLTVLTLVPLTLGLRVVYTARFVPQKIVKLFREHRPTVFVGIPSMYNALLHVKDAGPEDFASLRYAVCGGEPLPDAVTARFRERFGVTIAEGYGLTETSPVTNWCRPHEYRAHSVGRPLPRVVQKIVDIDTRRELPAGRDGEVLIAGPNVMRGYLGLDDQTRAMFENGFLKTGDIGRFDDEGHLYITGRLKDMMIVGGENVFPREIEEVLNAHPDVGASGVVGLPDPMRGEIPLAFVEPREGARVDPSSVMSWCRERLAGYKVPREVIVLDALPKGPTGKVLRKDLRARAAGAVRP